MRPPPPASRLDGLLEVLDRASRADGPIRLFRTKAAGSHPGLLVSGKGEHAALLEQLLGTLLAELPRAANQPRRVELTAAGLQLLLKARTPVERADRARAAAPYYRERLLRTWKAMAAPADLDQLRKVVSDLYGDLLEVRPVERLSDAATFKRSMARELVAHWSRVAPSEARRTLADVMVALGLRPIEVAGQVLPFDGRRHASDEELFPGDLAEVVDVGWRMTDEGGEWLLQKARVRVAGPGSMSG